MSKSDQRRARMVGGEDPGRGIGQRTTARAAGVSVELLESVWGPEPALETGLIGKACGGRSRAERHGDLSRDGAMYVALRHGGLRLCGRWRDCGIRRRRKR